MTIICAGVFRMKGVGVGVEGERCGVWVWGVGCGEWGVGCGEWGVGCGVWGVGCRGNPPEFSGLLAGVRS